MINSAQSGAGLTILARPLPDYAAARAAAPSGLRNAGNAPRPLQPEHKQHGLIALLAQFRSQVVAALGDGAEAGQDGDVLLAAGLEGDRRRIEAGADIDLP